MRKRKSRRTVDRRRHADYSQVAEHFFEAAGASIELEYWTAACVLVVHSAIAYVDALSIKISGQRSASDDHDDAVALLTEVVGGGGEKSMAVNQFRRIIEVKTRVSYLGDLWGPAEARELWMRLQRFRKWANAILER